jgi:hypothetical protein
MELEEKLIKKGVETLEKEVKSEIKKKNFLNSFKFSFLILFLFLAVSQHPDLLTDPISRFENLPNAAIFMMGSFHPLILTLLAYPFLAIAKFIAKPLIKPLVKAFIRDTLKQ